MVSGKKLIYFALGIVLLLGVASLAYVARARPRAEVAETLHDFGGVSEAQPLTHTFLIRNIGSKPVEIRRVHVDCKCTATAYDRFIPPGGQGAVTLSIKPFALRGPFAKKTEVFLNDPVHPKMVFTLKGIFRPLIEVQPGYIIRFRGKMEENLHRQVRLTSNLPEPWEISRYTNSIPQFVDVKLQAVEPGRIYVIEVRNKRQEAGKYVGNIELFTTSQQRPRLFLRVFGEVLPR